MQTSPIKVCGILKVADINQSDISDNLKSKLPGLEFYHDQVDDWHLYSPRDLLDLGKDFGWPENHPDLIAEIQAIDKVMENLQCGFFRMVNY